MEIVRTIYEWKSRNLTQLGRIAVIKTLILPKMNHLILTLPNPDHELIRKFVKFYSIISWGQIYTQ